MTDVLDRALPGGPDVAYVRHLAVVERQYPWGCLQDHAVEAELRWRDQYRIARGWAPDTTWSPFAHQEAHKAGDAHCPCQACEPHRSSP